MATLKINNRHIERVQKGRGAALLERLPDLPLVMAEIGVQRGLLSAHLLYHRPKLTLIMVDPWRQWPADSRLATKGGDRNAHKPQAWHDAIREKAMRQTRFAANRRIVVPLASTEAAELVADGCLDAVFIDAEHTYEACRQDMDVWIGKLKPAGLLAGHDIDNTHHDWSVHYDGIRRAVEETSAALGVPFEVDRDYTWFMRLP